MRATLHLPEGYLQPINQSEGLLSEETLYLVTDDIETPTIF